ncbi:MAG: hypothetical protein SCALA702_17070 [Melioribacteraceae bacterium]|nr:MAG: hypothetical protein SCALA702_17070 [Melioribacteraceae bacterium]
MKKKFTYLLFLLLLPSAIFAQTGKLSGVVTEAGTGEPLIGANIIIVGTSFGAATDINGEYTITNLEAGVYEVKSSYVGYQAKTITNVRINSGLTTSLDFQLAGEGFTVDEISVVAQKPLVNKSATNANRITTGEDIDALPVRGVNNILALTPGVTFQDNTVFVRGGRQDEVGFYLEGASITDPVVGGRAVDIPQDAIEEIQIQSGGYTAEYGGANAGIVYTQIKSGTPDWQASVEYITDNITFKGRDSRYDGEDRLGTMWYGYTEFVGTISGPIFDKRIKLFGLVNYNYQADANPQPYPGIDIGIVGDPTSADTVNLVYPAGSVLRNSLDALTGTGTLTLDFNPLIFRLVGTYTQQTTWDPWNGRVGGNIASMFNLDRVQKEAETNGAFSLKMTHILSNDMFYEVSAGYSFREVEQMDPFLEDNWLAYGDSAANAAIGYDVFNAQFERPTRINVYGFAFNPYGDVMSGYGIFNRDKLNFNAALSWELKDHSIKVGGEYQQYTIRNYSWSNEAVMAISGLLDGAATQEERETTIIGRGINNYGYDLFGEKTDEDGLTAPKKPVFLSGYVQDKIEWRDLIVNVGLRYDYIDIDNQMYLDPSRPELAINPNSGEIDEAGLTDVPTFSALSPRLGFSFAVTDQTVFHAQYGKFVQQTRLRDAYQGVYSTAYNLRGGFQITAPVGFNIRPTRTTQYEVGFTQQVGDFASFDITGFYKDIQDQVVFDQQDVAQGSPYGAYNVLTNGDFATTKGLELSFNMRRVERFQANANVSFQDAQGTGSFPNSNRGIVGAPLDGVTIFRPQYISPLEYNRSFSGSVNLDYRFGENDGPSFLEEFGVSALLTFASGHPFTAGKGGADLEGDARDRQPLEPLNSSRTPATFQIDLRIDKSFNIMDVIDANVYLYVINLFDTKNIENVFLRTGSTYDDGYLSDPSLGGKLIETYGPQYEAMYKAINIDYYEQWQYAVTGAPYTTSPYFYGPPRQIRLGVRFEY